MLVVVLVQMGPFREPNAEVVLPAEPNQQGVTSEACHTDRSYH